MAGEGVANAAFIQAGAADGIEQDSHLIVGEGGEVIGLLVEAGLVARGEFLPGGVGAVGIVGKHGFETFGGGAGELDKFIADGAVAAEHALLHAEFAAFAAGSLRQGRCRSTARWRRRENLR